MYEKFEFPLEVQRWIVRKRLVSDKETLWSTRVKNDEELYLYLVPARSVGVTKESARASYLGIPRQSSFSCYNISDYLTYQQILFCCGIHHSCTSKTLTYSLGNKISV